VELFGDCDTPAATGLADRHCSARMREAPVDADGALRGPSTPVRATHGSRDRLGPVLGENSSYTRPASSLEARLVLLPKDLWREIAPGLIDVGLRDEPAVDRAVLPRAPVGDLRGPAAALEESRRWLCPRGLPMNSTRPLWSDSAGGATSARRRASCARTRRAPRREADALERLRIVGTLQRDPPAADQRDVESDSFGFAIAAPASRVSARPRRLLRLVANGRT
jgi:hypothetical protein